MLKNRFVISSAYFDQIQTCFFSGGAKEALKEFKQGGVSPAQGYCKRAVEKVYGAAAEFPEYHNSFNDVMREAWDLANMRTQCHKCTAVDEHNTCKSLGAKNFT